MSYQYHAGRKSGTYFQVPLSAFAYGSNDKERLDAIISFGLLEAGAKWWQRATDDQRQERLAAWSKTVPVGDFKRNDIRHLHAVRGAEITGVTVGSVRSTINKHDALSSFCRLFAARQGADPLVRLKTRFVFEARDGTGISPRELSVLAAIYSVIGNKQGPVLITQGRIRFRALGYKSVAAMNQELPLRQDAARPLTDWQLRSVLEKLTSRKFFVRSTYGCRLTYYSHRMTQSGLRKEIFERKTFMFANKFIRRNDDRAMTDAINNQRAIMAGRPPTAPDALPFPVRGTPSFHGTGDAC